ncbi:hypothetical protein HID58_062766, partial [Brassica napus]
MDVFEQTSDKRQSASVRLSLLAQDIEVFLQFVGMKAHGSGEGDITRNTPLGGRLGEPEVRKQKSTRCILRYSTFLSLRIISWPDTPITEIDAILQRRRRWVIDHGRRMSTAEEPMSRGEGLETSELIYLKFILFTSWLTELGHGFPAEATSGGSGGSGGMTGERDSSEEFKHGDGGGSGGSRRHDGGVVIVMAMERSRAASEGGGKSSVAVV